MCGIAGFVGDGTEDDLRRMIEAIRYRGPDDLGMLFRHNVGLAHARLSIIDLSPCGHQPMWNRDETAALVFNGEIYNFREIRNEISWYPYRSQSDTEVILAAYDTWGLECFKRLHGMFAIALYDFRKRQLILARDRIGKKPLYYGTHKNSFLFGSELKALMRHAVFQKELDIESLKLYLAYDYVPTPRSIWKGICKLEPGTYAVVKDGEIHTRSFWTSGDIPLSVSEEDACRELDRLLSESVKRRLISDVPLGIFLSGGIDSSTMAFYAARHSGQKIHTFSIGFEEESYDESRFALKVSEHLGTSHHSRILSAKNALELVPAIPEFLDEPMADASILPTYLLSRFTRESVTVALGGDGADELFRGYPTFQAGMFLPFFRWMPTWMPSMFPVRESYMSMRFKLGQLLQGVHLRNDVRRHEAWLSSFPDKLPEQSSFSDVPDFYMRGYLMDEVLVKVDRASMACALEVRAPFLDTSVVEFVSRLPEHYKLGWMRGKYLLKKLMRHRLPPGLADRKKKGFAIPLSSWFRGELKSLVTDMLSSSVVASLGLIDQKKIDKLVDEHMSRRDDHRKKLWNLLVCELWNRKWLA